VSLEDGRLIQIILAVLNHQDLFIIEFYHVSSMTKIIASSA
jgi:hypothetical protein